MERFAGPAGRNGNGARRMRIATITTVRHNIGDDFAREGIMYLLEQVLGSVEFAHVHKHLPITARGGRALPAVLRRLPGSRGLRASLCIDRWLPPSRRDVILGADVVVQCGAPVFWKNQHQTCAEAEWVEPLFMRRVQQAGKTFLNIGGGTCQGYHSTGAEVWEDEATARFIRWLYDLARLTIVRDTMSARILEALARRPTVLPCPSLFARDRWQVSAQAPEYVVLNVMPLGGHYDLEGNLDAAAWLETCRTVVPELARRYPCRIVCHNQAEVDTARRLFPEVPRFYSAAFADYLPFFARARFGILNRVHAAFAMASFGRPAFVIGTDSRAHMVEQIGLRHVFLNDARPRDLVDNAERLDGTAAAFAATMDQRRQDARAAYVAAIGKALA